MVVDVLLSTMSTEAVLLMNLPVGITGEELMQQLLEQLPQSK